MKRCHEYDLPLRNGDLALYLGESSLGARLPPGAEAQPPS